MLETKNLCKIYSNAGASVEALKNINLNIKKGELLGIIGPSGAGKSTLLHLLGGLDFPTEGEVIFEGKSLNRLSSSQLAELKNKYIGFVFQFYHLLAEFKVWENIALPALLKRENIFNVRKKVDGLLEVMGLADKAERFPSELSGGEQQRVAIARAIINEPPLLLCDEPTGNLDSVVGERIYTLLRELHRKKHTTIVIVSHAESIQRFVQRTLYLKDGQLI